MNTQTDIKIVSISIIVHRDLLPFGATILQVANELYQSLERDVRHNELLKPCVKHIQVETITNN